MTAVKCRNCAIGCPCHLENNYHVAPEEAIYGFTKIKTSIIKMGSICPCCGCTKPLKM